MKKVLSIVLSVVLLLTALPFGVFNLTASAETEYKEGGYTYIVDPIYQAVIKDVDSSIKGDVTIPSTLGGRPVKVIGEEAFNQCSKITSINIPNSVTRINKRAFRYCSSLTSITIPDSVTYIGEGAFLYCDLESITLPFVGSSRTAKDTKDAVFGYIFGNASYDEYCLESNRHRITVQDYSRNKGSYYYIPLSLTSVTITDATQIPYGAFDNCKKLERITIFDKVSYIDEHAFYNCNSLVSITIPNSVASIEESAFQSCSSLASITIPNSVTRIEKSVFQSCSSLTSITIPNSVTRIEESAFQSCSSLTSITIPDSVASIEKSAFQSCSSLTSITIPDSVASIGTGAFQDCDSINDVYYAFKPQKNKMSIGTYNTALTKATWHYKTCDEDKHDYADNQNMICKICGISKKPDSPVLELKTDSSVTLVQKAGVEYSKDGTTWQDSNVFTNLSANTTYTFYQRVKESDIAFESEISDGLSVAFKAAQSAPSAPIISSFTDTTVTLMPNASYEYSKDGITWQTSNVFTDLLSGTKYTFYQRYAETDTHEASNKSAGTSITTDKAEQLLIPNAPTLQSFTTNSITLTPVDGCEYSKNGTTWQSSNVFSGLNCGTEYTFYQRYKETDTTYVGETSAAFVAKTAKGAQTAPSAPTLESKTHNTVTLTAVSGYEYSRDGINWQSSNVFTDLDAKTNYMFYQRKAETETHYAGPASTYLIVKTSEAPKYTPGDINDSGAEPDLDDVVALAQIVAGWQNVAHNTEALDVNRDGAVTLDDVVLLAQFVAGWNVTLS